MGDLLHSVEISLYIKMFFTKKNKSFDEDHPAVVKKKPRCKKNRDKFSLMHTIPMQVLSQRDEEDFGGRIKRGKRLGFTVYDALACKQCKFHVFFHKRFGFKNHSKIRHGKDGMFKMPSIPSRANSLPVRTTKTALVVPRRKCSSLNKRSVSAVNNRIAAIELVVLEDDEEEEIQIVDDHDLHDEIKTTSKSNDLSVMKPTHEADEVDDDLVIIDEIDVNENKIKSFKPKNYRWMESSPLYQPNVFLSNSLNTRMRKEESKDDLEQSNLVKSLDSANKLSLKDDVLLVDLVEEEVILGEAEIGQYEVEQVVEQSTYVRNLFNEDGESKRKTTDVEHVSSKKSKHDQEELLLMEDDDNEILDIQSMLEVSMDETVEDCIDVEVDEITVDGGDIIEVELEESPEEVELISLVGDDENVEFVENAEPVTNTKPESITDLVSLWAAEEEVLVSNKAVSSGKLRSKKRRSELKPYLTSRGL